MNPPALHTIVPVQARALERVLRVAICWPAPRLDRVEAALGDPALYEQMDGLSHLRGQAIEFEVIDSSPGRWNPGAGRGSLLSGIDPLRFLRQCLRYRHYDVLVGADSPSVCLFVLLKRCLRLNKPVVVIDPALDASYRNRMRLHDRVLPYVEEVVVFGAVQQRFLEARYGRRVRSSFIRHRMDCDFFDPLRAPPPAVGDERYVLAVGNDIGRDYGTLLAAAAQLSMPVLIHTRQRLSEPLPPNVQVQSRWISFEELRALYARAAVVVMPLKETVHASGTNSVLEALALGRPVVVSASAGIGDYIIPGVTALAPKPGNVDELRDAISRLWTDTRFAQQLGMQARAYALDQFAMPVYALQIAAVLRRAYAKSKAPLPPSLVAQVKRDGPAWDLFHAALRAGLWPLRRLAVTGRRGNLARSAAIAALRPFVRRPGLMRGLTLVRPLDYPQVVYASAGSMVLRAAYWHGVQGYEGVMADVWIHLCRRARSILEVGGNVGFFAVLGGRESDAEYQVFEPVPRVAAQLRLNLQLNGLAHVQVVQAAAVASAQSEFVCLNIPVEGDAMPVGAHLTEDSEVTGRTSAQVIQVAARAFPELIEAVDLIKIDAEGIEASLLESAWATLERNKPTLVIELLPQAARLAQVLRELAQRCGYTIWLIPGWGSDVPVRVEADQLTAELPQRHNAKDVVLSVSILPI